MIPDFASSLYIVVWQQMRRLIDLLSKRARIVDTKLPVAPGRPCFRHVFQTLKLSTALAVKQGQVYQHSEECLWIATSIFWQPVGCH